MWWCSSSRKAHEFSHLFKYQFGTTLAADRYCPSFFLFFLEISSKTRRSTDIINMLVNIYGSKELFIKEYWNLLADRLLSNLSYTTLWEIRYFELLKIRYSFTLNTFYSSNCSKNYKICKFSGGFKSVPALSLLFIPDRMCSWEVDAMEWLLPASSSHSDVTQEY